MSVLNICGFETGDLGECLSTTTGTSSFIQVQATTKRTGGFALRTYSTYPLTNNAYATLGGLLNGGNAAFSASNLYVRFYFNAAVRSTDATNGDEICGTSTTKWRLLLDSDGNLNIYANGAVVYRSTTVLNLNTWYRIECLIPTGTNATSSVKVNGTVVASYTGNHTATNTVSFSLGKISGTSRKFDYCFDDVCLRDDAWCGDGAVVPLLPIIDWSPNDWSGSPYWSKLNEAPPVVSAGQYIFSTGAFQYMTVGLTAATDAGIAGNAVITAAKSLAYCQSSSGSQTPSTGLVFASDDNVGPVTMGSGYSYLQQLRSSPTRASIALLQLRVISDPINGGRGASCGMARACVDYSIPAGNPRTLLAYQARLRRR